jgi:predicted site-specific integrase-resolvase
MKTTITLKGRNYDSANTIRDRYGITYLTLLNWTKNGVLPEPIRLNKRVYYDTGALEDRLLEGVK